MSPTALGSLSSGRKADRLERAPARIIIWWYCNSGWSRSTKRMSRASLGARLRRNTAERNERPLRCPLPSALYRTFASARTGRQRDSPYLRPRMSLPARYRRTCLRRYQMHQSHEGRNSGESRWNDPRRRFETDIALGHGGISLHKPAAGLTQQKGVGQAPLAHGCRVGTAIPFVTAVRVLSSLNQRQTLGRFRRSIR